MTRLKWPLLLLPLLFLTGCWSKLEVDEQVFVFALYIDKGEQPGTVEVTISSPLPNRMMSGQQAGSGSSNGNFYAMISKTGESVPDAIRLIQKDLTRQINFGHTSTVIIGREYAEAGIGDLLDWADREPTFHISSFLITATGKARQIAELMPLYEQMPSEVLRRMSLQRTLYTTTVKECLIAHYSKVGFATNYMSIQSKMLPSENEKKVNWAGIQGTALYQDDKMKGILHTNEARSIAWAANRLRKQAYTVEWDGGSSRASVLLYNLKANKKVRMTREGPVFTIHLEGVGSLVYKKDAKQRNDTELSRIVTELLNAKVNKELDSALHKSKLLGTDALKLGLLLEWKYPDYWRKVRENWPEYYKDREHIQTESKVEITIITNKP